MKSITLFYQHICLRKKMCTLKTFIYKQFCHESGLSSENIDLRLYSHFIARPQISSFSFSDRCDTLISPLITRLDISHRNSNYHTGQMFFMKSPET